MGHSTVATEKDGILSRSEAKAEIEKRRDGDHDNDWNRVHVYDIELKDGDYVFSENKAHHMVNFEIDKSEVMMVYFVDQDIWDKAFRDNKKLLKLQTKLKDLKKELNDFINENVKDSVEDVKPGNDVYFHCEQCGSKMNAISYLKSSKGNSPERCPICGGGKEEGFSDKWREKVYGKRFTTKRKKLISEIEALELEIKKIDSEAGNKIPMSEAMARKDMKGKIRTLIAADFHH